MANLGTRFWLTHALAPLLAGLWLWLGLPATGWDDALARAYFDPVQQLFPLRHAFWLTTVAHSGLKAAVTALALGALARALLGFVWPRWRTHRARWLWTALAVGLASGAVSLLKAHSALSCPWSVLGYGGQAPHLALFDALPPGARAGHCFPAGHASGGFALWAFYFGWRDAQPRRARWAFWGALALGSVMGWAQMARGAHFLSHTLWSAWVVWMVLLALYAGVPPGADERTGTTGTMGRCACSLLKTMTIWVGPPRSRSNPRATPSTGCKTAKPRCTRWRWKTST